MQNLSENEFVALVDLERSRPGAATLVVPVAVRLIADQLTPTVAYRRLVADDPREAPSFLLESVEGGERQGRYSILGAQPTREFVSRGGDDPFPLLRGFTRSRRLVAAPGVPACFLGGLVGSAAYDSVRFAEPQKLGFDRAPVDDRGLPDLCFGYYEGVVVFDHVERVVSVVRLAEVAPDTDPREAYRRAVAAIAQRVATLEKHTEPLRAGPMTPAGSRAALASNLTREEHAAMVAGALEFIRAGDVFQVVLGQRFERESLADPFDVYRALRCVNPSPYMVYMQGPGCILVASSPEILCRVRKRGDGLEVTNRPLAGTRRRGVSAEEDAALERDLLADPKERAEHIMLVDLGRNDVGVVAVPGTVTLASVMDVERYSHVMHISSTVTGLLRPGLDCWDALRAALPVGTISGAPKVRAMQIIDELEPVRRGPYGGGMGYIGLDGQMDMALALRTMVVPTALSSQTPTGRVWVYHLQASGGIVADSQPDAEYQETVNKAAGLARAIEVAEAAFGAPDKAR